MVYTYGVYTAPVTTVIILWLTATGKKTIIVIYESKITNPMGTRQETNLAILEGGQQQALIIKVIFFSLLKK